MRKGNPIWAPGGPGFSSKTDLWATPAHIFAALDSEFRFELDVCASPANAKCTRFFTAAEDGLAQEWTGRCWMNPPYGRGIGDWMEKAADSAVSGSLVVALVPARTDTVWWHEQVMARASEVRLVRGRLAFGDSRAPAPFPSAVIVYRPGSTLLEVVTWTPPCPERGKSRASRAMNREPRTSVSACRGSADKSTTDRGDLHR